MSPLCFSDPVYGETCVEAPLLDELYHTQAVQRLAHIYQGGVTAFIRRQRRTTRLDHSLGVMALLQRLGAGLEELAAGLLHDIGHTAFSHVIDFVFPNQEHTYHEDHRESMVETAEIATILSRHGLDERRVLNPDHYPLLEQPLPLLCADRLDYFLRDGVADIGRFSVAEARKPEACGQCHLGPDHPQIEIFMESKHGDIYTAYSDEYNWNAAPGTWTPGVDYRGPTCASCHMSGAGTVLTSHDVTERLSWELQAPLTVRPENFKPFPAKTNWKVEREKMQAVCLQCHSKLWVENHYIRLDKNVQEYNENYFKPAKKILGELYAKGLLDKSKFFDEDVEFHFYELWHHEGRRKRMGTAMAGPDYAWWHGAYDMKPKFNAFMKEALESLKTGKPVYRHTYYPNATGNASKPPEVIPKRK